MHAIGQMPPPRHRWYTEVCLRTIREKGWTCLCSIRHHITSDRSIDRLPVHHVPIHPKWRLPHLPIRSRSRKRAEAILRQSKSPLLLNSAPLERRSRNQAHRIWWESSGAQQCGDQTPTSHPRSRWRLMCFQQRGEGRPGSRAALLPAY